MRSGQHVIKREATAGLATLDGFLKAMTQSAGVGMHELGDGTCVRVETANTTYRIWVCDPRHGGVVILGGRFFPNASRALLSGSTFGGSLLKVGWIGLGMRMEIHRAGTTIVTSPVQHIVVESDRFGGWGGHRPRSGA